MGGTLGYSNKSQASPVTIFDNFIFAGEAHQTENKIIIQKIDLSGKTVWQQELDSLNNVDDIMVSGDKVCALVSFDHYKKVNGPNNTFSYNMFPVYSYVQLNIETGEIIKKEYQKMAVYLSGKNFVNPVLNSEYSYYLNNLDSAAFLSTTELEKATIVSKNLEPGSKIKLLAAGPESYHLLYQKSKTRNKSAYYLSTDNYGKKKKYNIELPIEPTESDRAFITGATVDSLFIILGQPDKITILLADAEGHISNYKQIDGVLSPLVFAGYGEGKVFVVQVLGREKMGTPGKLVVGYY